MSSTLDSSAASSLPRNWSLLLSYLTIVGLWAVSQYVYIPYVVHLLALVTAILYASCHASLMLVPKAHSGEILVDSQGVEQVRETLRKEDAYQFPILGSVTLFGLYLAFKYLDKEIVNFLIGFYFAGAGAIAMGATFAPFMEILIVGPNRRLGWEWKIAHSLPEDWMGPSPWDLSLDLTFADLLSLLASLQITFLYFTSGKVWFLNNIFGICFCVQGIRNFSVGSYQIAAILLTGLFFYDIFWVFGTEVMVKVATNLDGPIKLLLPRDSLEVDPETGKLQLSLLGLGDIVIPGFFLALMLRFDWVQAFSTQSQQASSPPPSVASTMNAAFPKPYFHSTLFGYVCGLGTTLFVMFYFKAAQPALLYLVPACLGSSLICAAVKGQISELLQYSEEEEEEQPPAETAMPEDAKSKDE